jgi:hypothetical protein
MKNKIIRFNTFGASWTQYFLSLFLLLMGLGIAYNEGPINIACCIFIFIGLFGLTQTRGIVVDFEKRKYKKYLHPWLSFLHKFNSLPEDVFLLLAKVKIIYSISSFGQWNTTGSSLHLRKLFLRSRQVDFSEEIASFRDAEFAKEEVVKLSAEFNLPFKIMVR